MEFVDEEDDVRVLAQFVEHGLDAFLELAAVFSSGHHPGHVEAHEPFVHEDAGHLALHYAQGKALHDGRLADARLADEHGIVFLAARQDLCQTFYLVVASHHRVETSFACGLGHVVAELVEGGSVGAGFPFGTA